MTTRLPLLAAVALCAAISAELLLTSPATGNQTGAPAGRTGSPGDGATCALSGCHSSQPGSPNGSEQIVISSNIPAAGYVPGQTYSLSLSVSRNGTNKFGFQLSPQSTAGTLLGTLASGTGSQLVGAGKYLTHTFGGTAGSGSRTWDFQWTAPASGTGTVTFYTAVLFTNSSSTSAGDYVQLHSLPVSESPVGLTDASAQGRFSIYPSPTDGPIMAEWPGRQFSIAIHSIDGQEVLSAQADGTWASDLRSAGLPAGVYLLRADDGRATRVQRLVVR